MFRSGSGRKLAQEDIYDVLRNKRRRYVLKELQANMGRLTVRGLAEAIAAAETGRSPPPRNIRQSVYNSLHQTHLPKLDDLDLVEYDDDRKTVSMQPTIRQVDLYMEVVTPYNVSWAEYYQILMLVSLLAVLLSEAGAPLISTVPPLVVSAVSLGVLGISTAYRLWSRRWVYFQQLVS